MVEAVVQAGKLETRYRRTGHGPQLLLLSCSGDGAWAGRMLPVLAERFRVFVPDVPRFVLQEGTASRARGQRWLADLIDGLGLDRPGVVASPGLMPMLTHFLDAARDRLDRVAIVHDAGSPEAVARAFPSAGSASAAHEGIRAFSAHAAHEGLQVFPEPRSVEAEQALLLYLNPTA